MNDKDEKYLAENWNPRMIYTCTMKQIHAWVDQCGHSAFYEGYLWELRHKKIVPGRYKVWFVQVNDIN